MGKSTFSMAICHFQVRFLYVYQAGLPGTPALDRGNSPPDGEVMVNRGDITGDDVNLMLMIYGYNVYMYACIYVYANMYMYVYIYIYVVM